MYVEKTFLQYLPIILKLNASELLENIEEMLLMTKSGS